MLIKFLRKNEFLRGIIYKAGKNRAEDMINVIKPFLNKNDVILDVGSGTCNVCEILTKRSYKITPLDVRDLSFVNDVKPVLFNGRKIPYENNKFDKALILTVLHHTPNPERILNEAKRVSKRIVIIEDVYSNWLHKYITYFLDSLLNFEFIGHPHTNKNNEQWERTFKKLGLKLIETKYNYSFLFFKHATYYLEK